MFIICHWLNIPLGQTKKCFFFTNSQFFNFFSIGLMGHGCQPYSACQNIFRKKIRVGLGMLKI